jgi:hypothetical protein
MQHLFYSVHTLPQLMYANLQISSKKSSTVSWQFFIYKILRLVPVVSCLYLILDHTTLAFSVLFDHQRSISGPHQPTTFNPQPHQHQSCQPSLSVNTTITGLTISEFILWTLNFRKQIDLILQIQYIISKIKITTHHNLNYNT